MGCDRRKRFLLTKKDSTLNTFNSFRKSILIQFVFFVGLFRSLILRPIRGANCPSDWLTPTGPCDYYSVIQELILWLIPLFLMILEIVWDRSIKGFIQVCRSNWLVIGFFMLAAFSLLWSINPLITAYKVIILVFSSLLAIYIGSAYRLETIVKNLSLFLAAVIILSFISSIFFPQYGVMSAPFYKGAWSGIFWHRNYLGCFMALAVALSLYRLPGSIKERSGSIYFNIIILVSASYLLLKSKSATGIITALVLVFLVIVFFAWEKWQHKLARRHYLGLAGIFIVIGLIILTNLDFVFGLLGRNTTLTGRMEMWEYLFQHLIILHPWLGFGYGAIWHYQGIRNTLALTLHWDSAVMIGDNGFVDILLHLGIVGTIVLLILIVKGFIHAIRYLLKERTLESAFPFIVLVFGMVANISLSLILESETFVWITAIALIVAVKQVQIKKIRLQDQ